MRRKKHAATVAAIQATYDATGIRDGACILFALGECDGRSEMNEHPSRAHTRGLPPHERFNTRISHRLCTKHHRTGRENFTSNTLKLYPEDARVGFDGAVVVVLVVTGRRLLIDVDRYIHYR